MSQQPPQGYEVKPPPTTLHANRVSQLMDKMAGQKFNFDPGKKISVNESVAVTGEAPSPPAENAVVDGGSQEAPITQEAETVEETPVEAPAPKSAAPARDTAKLAKSLEIQRRADEAAKRAREEKQRIEKDRQRAELRVKEAEKLAADVAKRNEDVARLEREYSAKLHLAKTNPLEFARQHGVDGANIAQFVKDGADPTRREIDILRGQMADAIQQLEANHKAQLDAVKANISEARVGEAKRNFFDFVESSSKDKPDQFQALDLVFSPEELWTRANTLAEKSDRLELGWDHDRLLEELENEAKADPRWKKLSSKFAPKPKTQNTSPKATAKPTPNTPSEEDPIEVKSPGNQRARQDNGQFRTTTPMQRHAERLNRIMKSGIRF